MLRACDLDMLRSAAWFLWRVVEDEDLPERRDALWRSRLDHLVRQLWPRELDRQDERVWAWLLRLAIALDEDFVDAVAAINSLPMPATIENAGILDELEESEAPHPDRPERADSVRWILGLPFNPAGQPETISCIESRLAAHHQ
jgi:hypothetical protein